MCISFTAVSHPAPDRQQGSFQNPFWHSNLLEKRRWLWAIAILQRKKKKKKEISQRVMSVNPPPPAETIRMGLHGLCSQQAP